MIQPERGAAADDFPPRRRLHAGREAALRDAVFVDADLLDGLPVEIHVRLQGAEHAPVPLAARAELGDAARDMERAHLGLGVEHHFVGGDARRRRLEHDVADGLELSGLEVKQQIVSKELLARVRRARLTFDFDLTLQTHAVGVDALAGEALLHPAGDGLRRGIARDEERGKRAREDDDTETHVNDFENTSL